MRGAHQLAVAAATFRLSQENIRVLTTHDSKVLLVHIRPWLLAMPLLRSSNCTQKCKPSRSSSADATSAVANAAVTPAQSLKKRADAAAALAGASSRLAHNSEGLPLTLGRKVS